MSGNAGNATVSLSNGKMTIKNNGTPNTSATLPLSFYDGTNLITISRLSDIDLYNTHDYFFAQDSAGNSIQTMKGTPGTDYAVYNSTTNTSKTYTPLTGGTNAAINALNALYP